MRQYNLEDLGERAKDEEMKAHLLKMMQTFDAFCKEHGLTYYLSGGTLLGAIRHKGFIPWDDDVDVNMPRPDCEKLMALCGGTIGGYELLPPNYTRGRHAYHWKLYDHSILVRKGVGKHPYPIFIDIFPIEGLPSTESGNIKHFKQIGKWKSRARLLWAKKLWTGDKMYKRFFNATLRGGVVKMMGIENIFNHVVKIQKSIPYETAEYIGVMATNVHTTEERVKKSEYTPVIEVDFEGLKFPGPAGYDTYLRQLYGDHYMELPPMEMRVSHSLVPYYNAARPEGSYCKVAICGLIKSQNLGELFIARSLEHIIEESMKAHGCEKDVVFTEVDILGRNDRTYNIKQHFKDFHVNYYGTKYWALWVEYINKRITRFARNTGNRFVANRMWALKHFIYVHGVNYQKRLNKYYTHKMGDADFIVVDGAGLLEYSYNEYQEPLRVISEFAEKRHLNVVYNAIGRAGEYDEADFRSSILRAALRSGVVKYVSARDSVENVQECAGPGFNVKLLADAAFWMKETYKPETVERKKIGIGLVRGNSLQGYGVNFKANNWVKLFSEIAWLLEERGYEFEFFTNGLYGDVVLGRKVLQHMGLGPEYLVERPVDDTVLYETINGYAGIITCRMHSSIAAFTLAVPSVILSWNKKVEKLMEIVGYPERAIKYEQFDPVYIVDTFEKALEEGVAQDKIDAMKAKAKESVEDYVDLIISDVRAAYSDDDDDDVDLDEDDDDDELSE